MTTAAATRTASSAPPRPTTTAAAGFEFAQARLHARLAWRLSETVWQRLRAARSLPALLDVIRGTPSAVYLTGVAADASLLDIDLAFRAQLRGRIDEVAGWLPARWQPAAHRTATLIDLPVHLYRQHASGGPAWLTAVPAIDDGLDVAPAADMPAPDPRRPNARPTATAPMHPALAAWLRTWLRCWPAPQPALQGWADGVAIACTALAAADLPQAATLREQLAARLWRDLHAAATVEEIGPFAFLALLALDLHRLRAECVRARLGLEAA